MMSEVEESTALYEALERHLAAERLRSFRHAAAGNRKHALQLYRWNVALSGAVYEALHVFEVVLRNAIDDRLREWNATQIDARTARHHSRSWLVDPAPLLIRLVRDHELSRARHRAEQAVRRHGRPVAHSDIVAQLSFGTWRFLLPDQDPGRRLLWDEAIALAFPRLNRDRADLVRSIHGIHRLRNRIAHLEPLLRSEIVRAQYRNMRAVLGDIDPAVEQWFVSNQRVTSILRLRS